MRKNDRSGLYNKILVELKRSIEKSEVNQHQIGKALSIKQSAVSSLLSGHSKMNVSQLITLCDLLGVSSHVIFFRALHGSITRKKQPDWIGAILYKSWIHLLVYVAATRPVSVQDLVNDQIDKNNVVVALDDLLSVGLLRQQGTKYLQSVTDAVIVGDQAAQMKCHQEIIHKAMDSWTDARRRSLKEYFKKRFNLVHVDRFTDDQILELETIAWKFYEKMKDIQMANTSSGYEGKEHMRVWNIHLMLSTPFELGTNEGT